MEYGVWILAKRLDLPNGGRASNGVAHKKTKQKNFHFYIKNYSTKN